MNPGPSPTDRPGSSPTDRGAESSSARRRRLGAVFGEVLPSTTRDERPGQDEDPVGRDDWLRDQVPPHHGG